MQRTVGASVVVAGEVVAQFDGEGLVALVGVTHDDGPPDAAKLARKIAQLRILRDDNSAVDIQAPIIVVSQFTLYADTKKGRRPSWSAAAPGDIAEPLIADVVAALRSYGLPVQQGVFGADMAVQLTNDGPVTLILET